MAVRIVLSINQAATGLTIDLTSDPALDLIMVPTIGPAAGLMCSLVLDHSFRALIELTIDPRHNFDRKASSKILSDLTFDRLLAI